MAFRRKSRLATQADSERLSGPALETFFRITDLWKLSAAERQKLLGVPPSTFFKVTNCVAAKYLQYRWNGERVIHVAEIGLWPSDPRP